MPIRKNFHQVFICADQNNANQQHCPSQFFSNVTNVTISVVTEPLQLNSFPYEHVHLMLCLSGEFLGVCKTFTTRFLTTSISPKFVISISHNNTQIILS